MRSLGPFGVWLVAGVGVLACGDKFTGDADAGTTASSSSSGGSTGSSGGSTSSSSGSGQPADATCLGFRPEGPKVTPSDEDGEPAPSTGGTLTDGTYVLDRLRIYDSNPSVELGGLKQTIVVSGNHYARAYYIDGFFSAVDGSVSGNFEVQGTRIVLNPAQPTCEDGPSDKFSGPFQGSFTASGNELTIVQPSPYDADWKPELHYLKQQ